jgi:hypothetical protein
LIAAGFTGVTDRRKDSAAKEAAVYVIPIVALTLVIVVGAAWSPIFALVIAIPLFLIFLAYVGFSRRADQASPPSERRARLGRGREWRRMGERARLRGTREVRLALTAAVFYGGKREERTV